MVEMTFQLYESQLTPHYSTINDTNTRNLTNSTDHFDSFNNHTLNESGMCVVLDFLFKMNKQLFLTFLLFIFSKHCYYQDY